MSKQQQGFTLVELMVSMVLSLSVIAGVGGVFLNMQKSNKIQRAMATMADESSYVQEILQKEIRRTGGLKSRSDTGGNNASIFLSHANVLNTDTTLSPAVPIVTSNISFAGGEYIKGYAPTSTPPNDAFVIRYQLVDEEDLGGDETSHSSSPCTKNILLNQSGMDHTTYLCNSGAALSTCENPKTEKHVVSVYFYASNNALMCTAQRIRIDTANTETCAKNCTSVSSTTNFAAMEKSIELSSNIMKLTMRYGVDSDTVRDNAANYYTDAANVTSANWKNVVSIRISVVMRSDDDNLTSTPMNYTVEGTTTTPTDYRLYKVFTTTIALRNQLI